MANTLSCSYCLFLALNVSICEPNVFIISVLKLSNRFPYSVLVTPLEIDFVDFVTISLCPRPLLAFPLEYFLHNSTIFGKGR